MSTGQLIILIMFGSFAVVCAGQVAAQVILDAKARRVRERQLREYAAAWDKAMRNIRDQVAQQQAERLAKQALSDEQILRITKEWSE